VGPSLTAAYLSTVRRPPSSPLFPYTTLFRSRLADGTLAGSALTMDRAVAYVVREVGVPVHEAAAMAALTPARAVGLAGRKGSLRVGKDADVAILDHDFQCVATFVKGRAVFDKAH